MGDEKQKKIGKLCIDGRRDFLHMKKSFCVCIAQKLVIFTPKDEHVHILPLEWNRTMRSKQNYCVAFAEIYTKKLEQSYHFSYHIVSSAECSFSFYDATN